MLRKSSAIDAILYSFQNIETEREELRLFHDQFRLMLEVHEEYHQLLEDTVKQEEDAVSFDELDENLYTFKHKVYK